MVSPAGRSRRGLLTAATAAAGSVLIDACGASQRAAGAAAHPSGQRSGSATTAQPAPSDVGVLGSALALERRTVAAYTAVIPRLPAAQAVWAKQFLSEELQHTGELISLIKRAGGTAPPPADDYDIGHPRDHTQLVTVLGELEALQISSYLTWLPRLSPGLVRAAIATILAADAQHITALRQSLGLPAMTSAFVGGAPRSA